MIVYVDLISGDQVLSDAYPKKDLLDVDGEPIPNAFSVQSKLVNSELGAIDIGANASAEGGDEGAEDSAKTVNNMVDSDIGFGYQGPNALSGEEVKVLYKSWCKAIKAKIEETGEKPKPFMQAAKKLLPWIQKNFADLEFYSTKSYNPETFVIGWWSEEANKVGAPTFVFLEKAYNVKKY